MRGCEIVQAGLGNEKRAASAMLANLKSVFLGHTSGIDYYRIQSYLRKHGLFRTLSLDENKLCFIYGDFRLESLEQTQGNFRVKLFKNTSLRELKGEQMRRLIKKSYEVVLCLGILVISSLWLSFIIITVWSYINKR